MADTRSVNPVGRSVQAAGATGGGDFGSNVGFGKFWRVTGDAEANRFLRDADRGYRKGFRIPERI